LVAVTDMGIPSGGATQLVHPRPHASRSRMSVPIHDGPGTAYDGFDMKIAAGWARRYVEKMGARVASAEGVA